MLEGIGLKSSSTTVGITAGRGFLTSLPEEAVTWLVTEPAGEIAVAQSMITPDIFGATEMPVCTI